jgi:hypothetical protein
MHEVELREQPRRRRPAADLGESPGHRFDILRRQRAADLRPGHVERTGNVARDDRL